MPVADGGGALGISLSRGGSASRATKESLSNKSIRANATEENEKP
jgi:hypothetical protein